MLNSLKTSLTILAGLLLGLAVATILAWYGTRFGADTLRKNVWTSLELVEYRQQSMADQALKLEPLLKSFGAVADADVFGDVMDERSKLAGEAALPDKLRRVQRLEEALLRSEIVWQQAGRSRKKVAAWEPWREHGRLWEKQKRLLVSEQTELKDSTDELNNWLQRWPASVFLAHKSFSGMVNAVLGDVWGNVMFLVRLSLDWTGYGLRRTAALVGQQSPPEPPKWGQRPKAIVEAGYMDPLPRLVFLADAPPPEDQYRELQYTREHPENYADVDLGEDKQVLENRSAPAGYEAPLPKPQKTVVYSATN